MLTIIILIIIKGGVPTQGQGQVVAPSGGVKISQIFFFPTIWWGGLGLHLQHGRCTGQL